VSSRTNQESQTPDLILLHPGLDPEAWRAYARPLWAADQDDLQPRGYLDVSHAFFDIRAFVRADRESQLPPPDPDLPNRIATWLAGIARQWAFDDVFAVQELRFWGFLRDRIIAWMHARMVERRALERLMADGATTIVGIGLTPTQRSLIRSLSEAQPGLLQPEIAFYAPPAPVERETTAERRARKLFFVLQDAWHGFKLLAEDIFSRRPKLLLVANSLCWQRSWTDHERFERRDIHLGGTWEAGRAQGDLRLYYRSDSYHPDVGAMTTGRLAPTYLRHLLFLLAQTSRGFWEARHMQRQWRSLQARAGFRETLVFEDLPVADLLIQRIDQAIRESLLDDLRTTRREGHFLRGMRPGAVLVTHDPERHRPLLVAAERLGVSTVAVQMRPLHTWDHATLAPRRRARDRSGLPDRLCLFSAATKQALVEHGGCDPSCLVVTGDPRTGGEQAATIPPAVAVQRIRSAWGVEEGQRVIGVVCRPEQAPCLIDWLTDACGERTDIFVLLRPAADDRRTPERFEPFLRGRRPRWFYFDREHYYANAYPAIDLLVATSWPDLAHALRARTPVVAADCGENPQPLGAVLPEGTPRAGDRETLLAALRAWLAQPPARVSETDAWRRFVVATFGDDDPKTAARRIMDVCRQALEHDA